LALVTTEVKRLTALKKKEVAALSPKLCFEYVGSAAQ